MRSVQRYLTILFCSTLMYSSSLSATSNDFQQTVNPLYTQYMKIVFDELKCNTGDDNCYQTAFQRANNEAKLTTYTDTSAHCVTSCGANFGSAGSCFGFKQVIKYEVKNSPKSEKQNQPASNCEKASKAFCPLLCKEYSSPNK